MAARMMRFLVAVLPLAARAVPRPNARQLEMLDVDFSVDSEQGRCFSSG